MNETTTSCHFCTPGRLDKDTLEETAHFRIIADHYGLTEGHLLLLPKEHYLCFGLLPEALFPAFIDLKARMGRFLQRRLQEPFYFEHGIAGQTVPHAHLHAIPGRVEILDALSLGRYAVRVTSWEQVQQFHRKVGPYLYFEQEGQSWVISGEGVPSGFIRTLAAEALGIPERADWRQIGPVPDRGLRRLWQDHWEARGLPV